MANQLDTSVAAIGAREAKRPVGRPRLGKEIREDEIRSCAERGMTVSEAGRSLNCCWQNLAYRARKLGIKFAKGRLGAPSKVDRDQLKELAAQGWTQAQTASALGIHRTYVGFLAKQLGIKFERGRGRGPGKRTHDPRSAEFLLRYQNGETLNDIGSSCTPPISRERVRQIMHKYHGTTAIDGGKHVRDNCNAEARAAAKERATFLRLGITLEQWKTLLRANHEARDRGLPESQWPTHCFMQKRSNVTSQGQLWELTPWEWWMIWVNSGKWEQRGRGAGNYCMTRQDRSKPWTVDNTIIVQFQNATGYKEWIDNE